MFPPDSHERDESIHTLQNLGLIERDNQVLAQLNGTGEPFALPRCPNP
jgi:hypothetical protein